jgi:hypothetical protein
MSQRTRRCKVVDSNNFKILSLLQNATNQPPDAPKTIDPNPDRHGKETPFKSEVVP